MCPEISGTYCPYKDILVYEQECLAKATNTLQITRYRSFYLQDGSRMGCCPESGKIRANSSIPAVPTISLSSQIHAYPSPTSQEPLCISPHPRGQPQPRRGLHICCGRSHPSGGKTDEKSHPHPPLNTFGSGTFLK